MALCSLLGLKVSQHPKVTMDKVQITPDQLKKLADIISDRAGCGCCSDPALIIGKRLEELFTSEQTDTILGGDWWRRSA